MKKIIVLIMLISSVCFGAVQSGWIKWNDTTHIGALGSVLNTYYIIISQSANQQVGRDGTILGAKLRIYSGYNHIGAIGFAALRATGETNEYTVVGKSEEITTYVHADNTFTFTSPITGVRSTDVFAVYLKSSEADGKITYLTTAADLPIVDDATKLRWYDTTSATYSEIDTGETITTNGGGTVFGVVSMCPLMASPKVIGVGDSISQGSPLTTTWRQQTGTGATKDRYGSFMQVMYRAMDWDFEPAGNTNVSNNASEVISNDLIKLVREGISVWDKSPEYLHVHVGVNDIYDERTLAQHMANLDTILADCRAHNCKLILTSIFPWTGNAANTLGSHAQNTIRDTWNTARELWCKGKGDVIYLDINSSLGEERLIAKSGDGTPTAGNLWDLLTVNGATYYDSGDGLGVHLSRYGATAAGAAAASELQSDIDMVRILPWLR